MLPTMYHCGILVATLLAVALGDDPAVPRPPGSPPSLLTFIPTSGPLTLAGLCFPGRIPTSICRFQCHMKHLEPYCDKEQQSKCMCRDKEEEETSSDDDMYGTPSLNFGQPQHRTTGLTPSDHPAPTSHLSIINFHPLPTIPPPPTNEPEKKHHVVFYIFDLNKIFGRSANATKGTQTAEEQQADGTDGTTEGLAPAGWAFQHIVAVLIVVLLFILILLEVYACYKKQTGKTNMESIFKTMPMPNKA